MGDLHLEDALLILRVGILRDEARQLLVQPFRRFAVEDGIRAAVMYRTRSNRCSP